MSDVFETLIAKAPGPETRRTLRVLVDGSAQVTALSAAGRYVIGRGADAHVHVNHATVSRRHAELALDGESLRVTDLGSANGSRVSGKDLAANEPAALHLGELFTVGDVLCVVYEGSVELRPSRSVGRDEIADAIERAAGFYRQEGPFSVCTLSWPGAAHHLDAVATMAPPRGHIAAITENLVAVLLPRIPKAFAEKWLDGLTTLFGRSGAEISGRVTGCPEDGESLPLLCPQALQADNTALRASQRTPLSLDVTPSSGVAMQKVHDLVGQVAATPTSILILGETGVGKEVMARSIHTRSNRANGPFVALNCAALPETLLESELFGYEKGAFTGANTAKPGLIEAASGGTLFLDELGEMPLSTQAKLLRVLEERTVLRVGSVKPKAVDIRLVAATNRDLLEEIQAKRFRPDLYYRLNSIILRLPPLRERRDELRALSSLFAQKAAEALGRPTPRFPNDIHAMLERYPWPGNVRELRNAIERLVLLAQGGTVSSENLPEEIRGHLGIGSIAPRPPGRDTLVAIEDRIPSIGAGPMSPPAVRVEPGSETRPIPVFADTPPGSSPGSGPASASLEDEISRIEKARILEALEKCAGNQTRAAEMLGITRRVLIGKMEKYGMPRPRK
ncbi:MAG: sigma 54-interacting transcriptional regulator [Myxococcales bacterium]|nr:sigma 54-interacting transcriptional regulator [Myxococcales bacterium]